MKKVLFTLVCLLAMMAAGTSLKAQEITITLNPGFTWISYLGTEPQDFSTVLGSFTPTVGDIILSQGGSATYLANGQWRGSISQFYPGYGYMYKSNRTEPVTLTFNMQQPALQVVVTTSEPTGITSSNAVVGGSVTVDEGNYVYARGVCWGMVQMPTVNGNHTSDGIGTGTFATTLIGLTPSTTYYIRAYVITNYGLAYGEEQSFTTLDSGSSSVPEGALDGLFSVNATQQVYFSQGNLQYYRDTITETWRFAENQYDYIGNDNSNWNGWKDLFGWGTSGYDHGANCYQPWSRSTNYSDYYAYGNWNSNLSDQSGMADWGYNAISNGGNQENLWRTLSQSEWDYVFFARTTTSGIRFAKATVNGVHGVILLPDSWSESAFILNDANASGAPYESNVITDSMWEVLEACGVVFLPAAGYRYGSSSFLYLNLMGSYWSTTYGDSRYAYNLSFADNSIDSDGCFYRYFGRSVRLVRNAE